MATKAPNVERDILSSEEVETGEKRSIRAVFSLARVAMARWPGDLGFWITSDSLDTIPGSPYTQKTITAPAHPGRFSFMPGSP